MKRFSLTMGILSLLFLPALVFAASWQKLEGGLFYRQFQSGGETPFVLEAIRVDPKHFRLDLVLAQDYNLPKTTVKDLAEKNGALFVINGGFFDEHGRSLGLLIQNGKKIQPVRDSNWGVFFIEKGEGKIVHRDKF
ncbi:MAG: hypothetical protein Q7S00_01945, partial [bacterium]|nr:hypothetical protein [bacterium]